MATEQIRRAAPMQMPDPIIAAATTFDTKWRHPRFALLEYSEVFSLFAQEPPDTPIRTNSPDILRSADCPDVYPLFRAKKRR
jgi:hypothetical protein